jgi:hypothetical protein
MDNAVRYNRGFEGDRTIWLKESQVRKVLTFVKENGGIWGARVTWNDYNEGRAYYDKVQEYEWHCIISAAVEGWF